MLKSSNLFGNLFIKNHIPNTEKWDYQSHWDQARYGETVTF